MATPFPRLTSAQFGNPANLRFAYPGCQTVVYNRNVMCNGDLTCNEKNILTKYINNGIFMNMNYKVRRVLFIVLAIVAIFIILHSIMIFTHLDSSIEIMKFRDNKILCLNREYFLTNRYNYKHIIGNYVIDTKFGNIYLKTGDKTIDHKGYLGTLFNVKNHTLKILDNNLHGFKSIYIYFDDNFSIELLQDLNIFNKIFRVKNVYFENEMLTFRINNFPDKIILKDNTSIKLIRGDGQLYSISIRIINDLIHLEVFDYNINDFYFNIQKNDVSIKSMKIIIDENWERIIEYK
jgi:hypothetical protein